MGGGRTAPLSGSRSREILGSLLISVFEILLDMFENPLDFFIFLCCIGGFFRLHQIIFNEVNK